MLHNITAFTVRKYPLLVNITSIRNSSRRFVTPIKILINLFVHIRRYFINQRALEDHFATKVHKRRLKALEIEPYTIEESERAAGHGNWVSAKKRKIQTLTADNINSMDAEVTFEKSQTITLQE